ncbi:MAG: hypothetical protein ACOYNY_36810 [Caldilineaceae bacterium]
MPSAINNQTPQIPSLCQYLPEVLWAHTDDQKALLVHILRVFEKIVRGIDDSERVNLRHAGDYDYLSLEKLIADLPNQFDPWRIRIEPWHKRDDKSLLDYLAECVGLSLNKEHWSEYQQRNLLTNVSQIYQSHGQIKGLYKYLDMYVTRSDKARIVIDDGVSVIQAAIQDNGMADFYDYMASTTTHDGTLALVDPVAIDIDIGANHLVIVDRGRRLGSNPQSNALRTAIWTVPLGGSNLGSTDITTNRFPSPVLVKDKDNKLSYPDLINPQDVVVDSDGRLYVVDKRLGDTEGSDDKADAKTQVFLFTKESKAESLEYTQTTIFDSSKIVESKESKSIIHPVAISLISSGSSDFLILLDRGAAIAETAPPLAASKLVIIKLQKNGSVVSDKDIVGLPLELKEPTALVVETITDNEWKFIATDAGATDSSINAAYLIRIKINISRNLQDLSKDKLKLEPLLVSSPEIKNPLVFPTDIVIEEQNSILVCDRGMKYTRPSSSQIGDRTIARQPALYRIHLSVSDGEGNRQVVLGFERIDQGRNLVDPAKLTFDKRNHNLYIVDPGLRYLFEPISHDWRLHPHEFAVLVNFSSDSSLEVADKKRIINEVYRIVNEGKPAHSLFLLRNL